MRRLLAQVGWPLAVLVAVITVWDLACRWLAIPAYVLPPPEAVLRVLVERRGNLASAFRVTGASPAIPSPMSPCSTAMSWAVASAFWRLTASGAMPRHVAETLVRLLAGFGIAAVVTGLGDGRFQVAVGHGEGGARRFLRSFGELRHRLFIGVG